MAAAAAAGTGQAVSLTEGRRGPGCLLKPQTTPKVATWRKEQCPSLAWRGRPAMGILGLPEEAHLLIAERMEIGDM